ncbi:MAG: efflux RND transporter periplasmic adaptor subunit [Actinomycetota bacterium]|nr:efflux RND transporter periplasmic adaptor subunit [Actinomycetota bacterium]
MREPAAAAAAGDHDDDRHLVSARLSSVSRRTWTLYTALIVTIGVVGWFAYSSIYGASSSAASGIARTVTASLGTVQSSVSASGNVSATQTSSPAFGTSGTLTALTVKVGSQVKSGQVIARVDATQAKATLASDQASLKSAESALATAQAGGNASQLAQNASTLASSKLQLSSAQQTLATDEAALETARKQLAADQRLACVASSTTSATGSSSGAATPNTTGTTGSTGTSATSSTSGNTRTTQAVSSATAPTASTDSPGTTTTKAVTLTGTVNPNGAATTYVFEYGTKASFGSVTRSVSAGEGTTAVSVEATISGLKSATTYVYRLVAQNAEGTAKGLTRTFTTATTACTADSAAITAAERTVAQQKLTVAQQSQSVASAQAAVSSAVDSATVAQAAAQVTQAQVTVATAAKAVRDAVLRAPISGTVTAVNASVGDTVGSSSSAASSNTGTAATGGGAATGAATSSTSSTSSSSSSSTGVVTISKLTKLEVVAGFAEADATKIKVGQSATVTLSALPNTSVAGTVTAVSPTPTVTSNVVTYDVTVRLISPPSTVRNGMTADASVTVATKSNVLQLPSAAITTSGAASTVSVLQNGKQTTARVTTGLVGSSTTEILSGIKAGDVIVEPTVSVSSSTAATSSTSLGGGGFTGGGGFPGGGGRPVGP